MLGYHNLFEYVFYGGLIGCSIFRSLLFYIYISAVVFLLGMTLPRAIAQPVLPSIFGDFMVVQQQKPFLVWGRSKAQDKITVTFAGKSVTTVAADDGTFELKLPAFDARLVTGPQELVVTGEEGSRTFKDVLVGEVWLCTGQSNMAFRLSRSADGAASIQTAKDPLLRLLHVPKAGTAEPQFSIEKARWVPCTPDNVRNFSAVGYYFGKDLREALDVPVGLIQSAFGGSPAEAWTPRQDMEKVPEMSPLLAYHDELASRMDQAIAALQQKVSVWKAAKAKAAKKGDDFTARKPKGIMGMLAKDRPAHLFNAMLAPLAPYQLAGAIWYQGESNAGRAKQYQALLPAMIAAWRRQFRYPEMPFGIVQLANYGKAVTQPTDSRWAELRDAQLQTYRNDPNAGLAVTIDLGEADDIHPKNKKDVGNRLAAWALAQVYGKDGEPSGPVYDSMTREGDSIRLSFDHVGGGLEARGSRLEGFAIAGADRQFVWAEATIDNETVLVHSDQVAEPIAVRYAWANNPSATLYNKAGLPASPFRTDQWKGLTEENLSHPPLPEEF